MKRIPLLRKCPMLVSFPFLLSAFFVLPVSANSAQFAWRGTTAAGAIITDDTCALVVEHESLTFDLQEFPEQHYKEMEDYLAYSGKVTAEYTFYNPADYTVCATLVFPFGKVPDYGYLYDDGTGERILNGDTEKYDVTVDDTLTETKLRHTLSIFGSEFEMDTDMALLHEGYVEDSFYSPDMLVTRYTYVPKNVDVDTYDAASAAFVLSSVPHQTKVLIENQSGGEVLDDGVRMSCWVETGKPVTVDVIGESLQEMPEWKFYENGACEKEIDGTMKLVNTEVTTLKKFVLSQYNEESGVLEHDWYNAMIESMKYAQWTDGVISGSEFRFDISDQLMRWYEYQIVLEPGEKTVNKVTAPIYPSININDEPPVYEYTYLLSPAKSWESFGTLDIVVNTPYDMTEQNQEGFKRTDTGYVCNLPGLPENELVFTLCEAEESSGSVNVNNPNPMRVFIVVLMGLVIIIAAGVVIKWKHVRR